MIDTIKELLKQPYWVIALILGTGLVALPCVKVDKDHNWSSQRPVTPVPIVAGGILIALSVASFGFTLWQKQKTDMESLDLSTVKEANDVLSTAVAGCEICIVEGRAEEFIRPAGVALVLPCSEYFDDECARDPRSALGAYVECAFGGRALDFVDLMKREASRTLGPGVLQDKTKIEKAESFGSGKCLFLQNPLGFPDSIALLSTTTQRAGQGLAAQISCLFEGMHELTKCLADARINEAVMPVLGSGHGGIHPALAFMGLLIAVAEAAQYGQGSQRLKRVTIVVFKKDLHVPAQIDRASVRRALALIGSKNA